MIILSDSEELFAVLTVKYGSKTKAYKEAFNAEQFKPETIRKDISRLSARPDVVARIEELRQTVIDALANSRVRPVQELVYDKLSVFQHWQDVALADVGNIIQHRRICCRHCHGVGHAYQWLDKQEHATAKADALDTNMHRSAMKPKREPLPLPTDAGGYGFQYNKPPVATCPKCFGEGKSDVLINDTSLLGQRERRLIKSIKAKANGEIEIVFHDQMEALSNMAKALGMLTEKFQIVNPGDKPDVPALPLDPVEASRMYAEFIKG